MKTILLDLDDTLLDFRKAETAALKNTLIQLGIEPGEDIIARYSNINAAQWELLEEGKLTREQVLVQRFGILFSEWGIDCQAAEAQEVYGKQLGIGHYFIPGAEKLLEELHRDYDLYLVSNGTAVVQEGRIESAGIARYFKEIFISQNIGFNKPRKEFFDCCFEKIPRISKENTIIIGDSLTSDIRGGNNAGIHTCWFNPKKKPAREDIQTEYEVSKLEQIPKLLKNIKEKGRV